ncbi:DUF4347 domain-containing protein [Allocoleopsis franciscana]|uniref:DUF4347 domain-containing protein n=1 Tax=Allocoleopsis franciscana PCC 7113 TaxID=1173027 RepID=K9WH87_9CYAN|nr:DUF4347 domain-containing protein [Allocoleopsis franciscana]AFZ19780.1 hypothetical protein Mic7113_4076 [Allocoleopsis franciscana PCC 7113]
MSSGLPPVYSYGERYANSLLALVFIDSQVMVIHGHLLVNGKNFCQSLMFIDSLIANANKLNENVAPGVEVIFFDAIKDEVAQIAEALTQHTNVSHIHIVSHGQAGSLPPESTQLQHQVLKTN